MSGERRTQVRRDGPFIVYKVSQDTLDGTAKPWGFTIEGPGSESSRLLSDEEVEPKLTELKAKLRP